jgi:hypothetical protein
VEIASLATKLLGTPEEISGDNPCANGYRWTIFGNHRFTLYLYRFIGDGWSSASDFPKRFISVGLVKPYVEESAKELEAFSSLAAWMLLIGKPSPQENSPRD